MPRKINRTHGARTCFSCGRKRRYRDGEFLPCDHSTDDMDGIDWQEFKDECLKSQHEREQTT